MGAKFKVTRYFKSLENEGNFHSGELKSGEMGVYWVDEAVAKIYEYPTDNEDLCSTDLTEEQLQELYENGTYIEE